jgi:hypothetical protein
MKAQLGKICVMPEKEKMNRDQPFDSIELRGAYEHVQF